MINENLSRFKWLKDILYDADGVHKVAPTAQGRRRNSQYAKELSRLVWDITDAVLNDPLQTELHNLLTSSSLYQTNPHQFLYQALMNNDLDLVVAAARLESKARRLGRWGALGRAVGVSARDEASQTPAMAEAAAGGVSARDEASQTPAMADDGQLRRSGRGGGGKSRRGKSRRRKPKRRKSRRRKSKRGKSRRTRSKNK